MKLIYSFLVTFGIILGGTDLTTKIIDFQAKQTTVTEQVQTQSPVVETEKPELPAEQIDFTPVAIPDIPKFEKIPEITVNNITTGKFDQRIEMPEINFDSDPLTFEKIQLNPPLEKVDYYENVDGQQVQSPTKYEYKPQGATALCYDGTYSFSSHRRGTCSHHGGVKEWLR